MEPFPYSLRELVWMAEARKEESWDHTAHIICYQVNSQAPKGRRYKPSDFMPKSVKRQHDQRRRQMSNAETAAKLNAIFGKPKE